MAITALKVLGGNAFSAISCFIQPHFARAADATRSAVIVGVVIPNDVALPGHRHVHRLAFVGGLR